MSDWAYIKKLGGEGILSRQDVQHLRTQRDRVLYLMLDGLWHSANEIVAAAKGTEGLRRLRELRDIPNVTIERRRCHKCPDRLFFYRLQFNGMQGELFHG